MDTAPPSYSHAVGSHSVGFQNFHQENLTTQSQVVFVPVIVTPQFKLTEKTKPHSEYCPRCKEIVITRTEYVAGTCWGFICGISIFFLLLPLIVFLFCNRSKDVRHYCPNCGFFIAWKRRGCC